MLSHRRSTFHPYLPGRTNRRECARGYICFSQRRTSANSAQIKLFPDRDFKATAFCGLRLR